jgi:hypothetical protein
MKEHDHTPEGERRIREAALDETIAESFPASDPPSSLPNPDEHDAEGSGVVAAETSRPPASTVDIVVTADRQKKSNKASAPASSRSTKKRTTAPEQVTHGEVARRAYNLFLARGCEHGHDLDDWLQAERELRGTLRATPQRARNSSRQVSRKRLRRRPQSRPSSADTPSEASPKAHVNRDKSQRRSQ